ncbi:hypothetical protein AGMMS50229_18600 [Campylobacterota bacterium]|nr:hypothetical protein AGMMS50229_18600 [Campylobacterota bacterium]
MSTNTAQKIVDAVMQLLADGKDVTVAAIARLSGVSVRSIHRWKAMRKSSF